MYIRDLHFLNIRFLFFNNQSFYGQLLFAIKTDVDWIHKRLWNNSFFRTLQTGFDTDVIHGIFFQLFSFKFFRVSGVFTFNGGLL